MIKMNKGNRIKLVELPEHVLIKIFAYTSVNDRLNLMLVNKQFNNLISQVKETMQDIRLKWRYWGQDQYDEKWIRFVSVIDHSNRSYFRIEITAKEYDRNLWKIGKFKSLKRLFIDCRNFDVKDLIKIVNNLPKLESLETDHEFLLLNTKAATEKIKCKTLKTFSWDPRAFIHCFAAPLPNFIELSFSRYLIEELDSEELDLLRSTLANIPTLKTLELEHDVAVAGQEFPEKVKFKLHDLSIRGISSLLNVVKFLRTQRDLTKLFVDIDMDVEINADIMKQLLEVLILLPKLETLRISMDAVEESAYNLDVPPNPNIVSLHFEDEWMENSGLHMNANVVTSFVSKMPNLKELNLCDLVLFRGHDLDCLSALSQLEILTFLSSASDPVLPHLNLQNLKSFYVYFNRNDDLPREEIKSSAVIAFLENHQKLENLAIWNSKIQLCVWDFISENFLELDSIGMQTTIADYQKFMKRLSETDRIFEVKRTRETKQQDETYVRITIKRSK